ncbi:MAG: hypothetical protein JWN13_2392 [Betaproteobacteria bacterium]|jgi:hypothetical protein|nr:hypothetical protein [Betaproteobacteria bacterium]
MLSTRASDCALAPLVRKVREPAKRLVSPVRQIRSGSESAAVPTLAQLTRTFQRGAR